MLSEAWAGLVIGKGGETIKRLSEQYGVKLVFVQDTITTKGSDKPLQIIGEPEKVARAKAAILEMLNPINRHRCAENDARLRNWNGIFVTQTKFFDWDRHFKNRQKPLNTAI